MSKLTIRSLLWASFSFTVLAAQAVAQASVENTLAVGTFVNEPDFCLMFVGAPNREDGVSRAYVLSSDKALDSLLRANASLSIPEAFAFIQQQCEAKLLTENRQPKAGATTVR